MQIDILPISTIDMGELDACERVPARLDLCVLMITVLVAAVVRQGGRLVDDIGGHV